VLPVIVHSVERAQLIVTASHSRTSSKTAGRGADAPSYFVFQTSMPSGSTGNARMPCRCSGAGWAITLTPTARRM
jgi:hypothetical protein